MADIQQYVVPHYLYRYRPAKNIDQELDAIERGYLYGAAYHDLNDPMEGEFRSSRRLRQSDRYSAMLSQVRENKESIGLCSFSEVHGHEVMWTHYANQFKGVCIQYSLRRLLDSMPPHVTFVRMYYNDVVPMVSRLHRDTASAARMILSCKTYRWLYERDWRMFGALGENSYENEHCITKIYLGARMSESRKRRLFQFARPRDLVVEEMSIDAYKVDFDTINP